VVVYAAAAPVRVCVDFRAKTQLYGLTHGRRRRKLHHGGAFSEAFDGFFSRHTIPIPTPRTILAPRSMMARYTVVAPRRLPLWLGR